MSILKRLWFLIFFTLIVIALAVDHWPRKPIPPPVSDDIVAGGLNETGTVTLDPVAAAHWIAHGIESAKLSPSKVLADFVAFVSYRCKAGVCWKPDTIKAGEIVYYDASGAPRIRGRCGNLISAKKLPDEPSTPDGHPLILHYDNGSMHPSAGMIMPPPPTEFIGLPPVEMSFVPPNPIVSPLATLPPYSGGYPGYYPIFPYGGILLFPPDAVATPEVPTWLMAASGLLALVIKIKTSA